MNDVNNEFAYNLLQYEYLRRKGFSNSESELSEIFKVFPEDWFLKYTLKQRIDIISVALKNELDLSDVIENFTVKK